MKTTMLQATITHRASLPNGEVEVRGEYYGMTVHGVVDGEGRYCPMIQGEPDRSPYDAGRAPTTIPFVPGAPELSESGAVRWLDAVRPEWRLAVAAGA